MPRSRGNRSKDSLEGNARPEETARHFTAAVAIRTQNSTAHKALGQALYALGKTDEAVRLEGDRPGEAIFAPGALLEWMGRGDEAVAVY